MALAVALHTAPHLPADLAVHKVVHGFNMGVDNRGCGGVQQLFRLHYYFIILSSSSCCCSLLLLLLLL